MPKTVLKRWLQALDLRRYESHFGLLGERFHEPDLWHLNRRSVSGAFAVGLFTAFQPIPFQMLVAAAAAIVFRVNVPLSIILVWVNNPFTMPAILYGAYKTGGVILQLPTRDYVFELNYQWLKSEIAYIWQPVLVGSFVFSVVAALGGYVLIRTLWRIRVAGILRARKLRGLLPRVGKAKSDRRREPPDPR